MDIKFIKSPQFANEFENFKERKINIYKAIHKTIKKIVEIEIEDHMQSFDSLMIVEIYVEIYKEVIYVLYTAKKIDDLVRNGSDENMYVDLEFVSNGKEYKIHREKTIPLYDLVDKIRADILKKEKPAQIDPLENWPEHYYEIENAKERKSGCFTFVVLRR